MDGELYRAAIEGNAELLLNLFQNDGLILDRTNSITTHLETPLHIAAMRGHERLVAELLKLKPGLASDLDFRQSSPLHIASLKGYVGIVRELVRTNPDMCLARDRDGRNPVHLAAMMGRTDVLKELVRANPEAARATVNGAGTILHFCVEYSHLEALKVLLETMDFRDLVNSRDRNGNTVLHVSVADKQVEMTEHLLSVAGIEVNTLNMSGMTAMDILIQRRMDTRDAELEEILNNAGAVGKREILINPPAAFFHARNNSNRFMPEYPNYNQSLFSSKEFQKVMKRNDDWLDKKRSAMMVVATLIAGMAFQVGVNPPPNVWNNGLDDTSVLASSPDIRYYLTRIYVYLNKYARFYLVNTTGFIASLSIIFLLMSGLPLKNRIFTWILMAVTWISITAIALTYTVSLILAAPKQPEVPEAEQRNPIAIVGVTVFVWLCLMALLVFGHTIRLLFKTVKMLAKALTPKRRKPTSQGQIRV